jgi:hypothetical protein
MRGIDMFLPFDPAADKSKAGAVEHHDADTRAVGQIFEAHVWRRIASGE